MAKQVTKPPKPQKKKIEKPQPKPVKFEQMLKTQVNDVVDLSDKKKIEEYSIQQTKYLESLKMQKRQKKIIEVAKSFDYNSRPKEFNEELFIIRDVSTQKTKVQDFTPRRQMKDLFHLYSSQKNSPINVQNQMPASAKTLKEAAT